MSVKVACPTDFKQLAQLHHTSHTVSFRTFADQSWLAERHFHDYLEFWREYLSNQPENERTWLVDDHSAAIGTVTIMAGERSSQIFQPSTVADVEAEASACLRLMYVNPDYQRMGLGSSLVKVATKFAASQGYQYVTLITHAANQPARAFYERMGWQLDALFQLQVEEFFDEPAGMRQRARYVRFIDPSEQPRPGNC